VSSADGTRARYSIVMFCPELTDWMGTTLWC